MIIKLSDIITRSSNIALIKQKGDGSFPPGWNGPYHDLETPVRNTAHWLITLAKSYEITGDNKFINAIHKAAEYLLKPCSRPMNAAFFCRKNPKKDFSNGLIGQAWAIEGLLYASKTLGDHKYEDLANKVFLMHPFDEHIGLWKRVNVDGSYNTFDMTFNHQLWFAAVGSLLAFNTAAQESIRIFLDRTHIRHLQLARNGRITHKILPFSMFRRIISKTYPYISRSVKTSLIKKANLKKKEIGYHAFNLYALAILKQQIPHHQLWKSHKLLALLNYINQDEHLKGVYNNIFAYPYNPVGFEIAFAFKVFNAQIPTRSKPDSWWVNEQLRLCYDNDRALMCRNTTDEETLSARLYEATRLIDIDVSISDD